MPGYHKLHFGARACTLLGNYYSAAVAAACCGEQNRDGSFHVLRIALRPRTLGGTIRLVKRCILCSVQSATTAYDKQV